VSNATWSVSNQRSGGVVGAFIAEADGPWRSFKGLMLKKRLDSGHGLIFRPARGIHTHFMRFPIDLVFINERNCVAKVRERMAPWRFGFSAAAAVIELAAGSAKSADVRPGDQLIFTRNDD
jgi:uncharacterized protein